MKHDAGLRLKQVPFILSKYPTIANFNSKISVALTKVFCFFFLNQITARHGSWGNEGSALCSLQGPILVL